MTNEEIINEQYDRLNNYFNMVMNRGMSGKAVAVWPIIIRRWGNDRQEVDSLYIYEYPETFFRIMRSVNKLDVTASKKSDRLRVLKSLIDKLHANDIDVHLFHFGIYLLYGNSSIN